MQFDLYFLGIYRPKKGFIKTYKYTGDRWLHDCHSG